MILLVIVPIVIGLMLPQRWYWLLGVPLALGFATWALVRNVPDVDRESAATLGLATFGIALLGVALGAGTRWAITRYRSRRAV